MKMKYPIMCFGDIYEIFEYLKSLNVIDRHYAYDYHVYEFSNSLVLYKFSNSLVLYTDYNDNILFDITLETNDIYKRLNKLMNKDTTINDGYITFIETLERKTKIEKILK